jgi:hypothetical protein
MMDLPDAGRHPRPVAFPFVRMSRGLHRPIAVVTAPPDEEAEAPNIVHGHVPNCRTVGNFEKPPSTAGGKGGMIPRDTLIRASRF